MVNRYSDAVLSQVGQHLRHGVLVSSSACIFNLEVMTRSSGHTLDLHLATPCIAVGPKSYGPQLNRSQRKWPRSVPLSNTTMNQV